MQRPAPRNAIFRNRQTVPFDPVRDFSPITLVEKTPNVLVVHPSVPVKSIKELIALAKAKPGQLNYASATPAGTPHLSTESLSSGILERTVGNTHLTHSPQ